MPPISEAFRILVVRKFLPGVPRHVSRICSPNNTTPQMVPWKLANFLQASQGICHGFLHPNASPQKYPQHKWRVVSLSMYGEWKGIVEDRRCGSKGWSSPHPWKGTYSICKNQPNICPWSGHSMSNVDRISLGIKESNANKHFAPDSPGVHTGKGMGKEMGWRMGWCRSLRLDSNGYGTTQGHGQQAGVWIAGHGQ